jgi:SpoVK/Ycf46/Vps4 family AAA+-type ATPase
MKSLFNRIKLAFTYFCRLFSLFELWCFLPLTLLLFTSLESDKAKGYSGADVANVCRDASMMSVRRVMEVARKQGLGREQMQAMLKEQKDALHTAVSMDDFVVALSKVSRSVSDQDLNRFKEWMDEFGSI